MRRIAFCLLIVLAAGCGRDVPTSPLVGVQRIVPAAQRFLDNGGSASRLVIHDPEAFASVWNAVFRDHHPVPPVPEVDFSKEMVLVAAMGVQRSGGYEIEIGGIRVLGDRAIVLVRSLRPGDGCVVSLAMTAPIDIVKAPIVTGLIQFEDRVGRHDCQ